MNKFIIIGGLLCAGGLFCRPAQAQFHDQIGLTALRAVTTNLNGAGLRVAVPEANLYTNGPAGFEINPANVGQPASLFTYASAAGTTNVYPNAVGTNSWHAEDTGNYFFGMFYGVATNVAHVDNSDADYFITNIVQTLAAIPDTIVNQSFADYDLSSQSYYNTNYDNYADQYKTLFITAAGDGGPVLPPSTCYNGISVAAYFPVAYSSVGPTLDNGRCKPDITAVSQFTSTSTPMVSGGAALLLQAGVRGDGGGDTNSASDPRTLKALLLNGAVKPSGWTNGAATPLDARYGAGMLNVLNSYEQLAGGKNGCIVATMVATGGAHPPTGAAGTVGVLSGWDFSTNTSSASSDAIRHYYFNATNNLPGAKFTATSTLVWNRHQNQTNINNLNLYLYNCANSNLVACSTSRVDNVEHIYVPQLAPGRYDLQVWKAGGSTVTTNETYALAFEFFSDTLAVAKSGANTMVTWPVYPAGFLVESATNLISPAWSTNYLPPATITNSRNSLLLNATNSNRFFRLRRPNL